MNPCFVRRQKQCIINYSEGKFELEYIKYLNRLKEDNSEGYQDLFQKGSDILEMLKEKASNN